MSRGRFAELLLPLFVGRFVAKLMKMSLSLMYFCRFLISVKHGCILTSVKHGKHQVNQNWGKQRQIKSKWGSNQIDVASMSIPSGDGQDAGCGPAS
jgi:hypothetical protein